MYVSIANPHFDVDFTRGLIGEDLINNLADLIKLGKIEVKTDYRAIETGNFYVETWQYSDPSAQDRRKSGINVTQAESWAFVIPQTMAVYIIATEDLKKLMRHNEYRETRQPIINSNTNASIGRLVPVMDVAQMMVRKI